MDSMALVLERRDTATALHHVVTLARRVGISPMLVDLLADSAVPDRARRRALAHVTSALAALGSL